MSSYPLYTGSNYMYYSLNAENKTGLTECHRITNENNNMTARPIYIYNLLGLDVVIFGHRGR